MTVTRINPEYNGIKAAYVTIGTVTTGSGGWVEIPARYLPVAKSKTIAGMVHHWSSASPANAFSFVLGNLNYNNGGYILSEANTTITGLSVVYLYRD